MPPPANLRFEPCQVPMDVPSDKYPNAHAFYARRKFVLPDEDASRTLTLIVDGVISEGTAYVNGQRVGGVRGVNAPLVADVSRVAHAGENELVLIVRDNLALTNPLYVNKENPAAGSSYLDAPGYHDPHHLAIGSGWGSARGAWLESSPLIAAQDVKIETSVRKGTIVAHLTAANSGKNEAKIRVKVSVEDARKPILTLGETELVLKPGETKPLDFAKEWRDPRLWSWKEPNLYVLAVELTDAAGGKRLDLTRERFGFRESWFEGDKLYLNGHLARLKGTGCNPAFNPRCGNAQVGRCALSPDYYDETGMMSTEFITYLTGTVGAKYKVESDAFWETTRANAIAWAKRNWNHPCVIAWDLSNEWFTYAPYAGADMPRAAKRFESLSDAVVKLDPTRWTLFNGDGDLDGLHNTLSPHYMQEAMRNPSAGFEFAGHSGYFPDAAFWRPLDRDFVPEEELLIDCHQNKKWRRGSKPLMDTEDIWRFGNNLPPATCKFGGEENVLTDDVDFCGGPMLWRYKQNIDGQRDMGMALYSIHDGWVPGTLTRCYPLQTFIMPDVAHHGFSGRKLVRSYSVLNDLLRPANLNLKWKLVGETDGQAAPEGADEREIGPGQTWRNSLSFMLPAVPRRTKLTLQLRLESEGAFVYGEDRDIEVWPDSPISVRDLARKVLLYDPKGRHGQGAQVGRGGLRDRHNAYGPGGRSFGVRIGHR